MKTKNWKRALEIVELTFFLSADSVLFLCRTINAAIKNAYGYDRKYNNKSSYYN